MTRSRAKGTAWESTIVDYLRANGVPHAERRAMAGGNDRGDIAGLPGVVIEAKSAARVELAAWLSEAEAERLNDGADLAVVWIKRRGMRTPAQAYVVITGETLVYLLVAAGYIAGSPPQGGEAESASGSTGSARPPLVGRYAARPAVIHNPGRPL